MSDQRHLQSVNDPLDQSRIDRELARLLSIAPSPEFGARVRQRIHDDRARRPSPSTWWIGLAAAAALVVIAVAASRTWPTDEAPREARAAIDTVLPSAPAQPRVRSVPVPGPDVRVRRALPPRVASPAAARDAGGPAQPQVIVSRDQLRAIARLRELIVSGELTEKNLPPAGSAPDALTEIRLAPLTIAPLTLPPVETVGGRGSER